MKSKKVTTSIGLLDIYRKEDWDSLYSRYLEGEFSSIPDISIYLGIGYKIILGVFNRFKYNKLSVSDISKRCSIKNKKTKKEKYGDENYNNRDRAKDTLEIKYGNRNYVNIEKMKKTKKEKYGDENYCNGDRISEILKKISKQERKNITKKMKKTKKEKYGDENYNNILSISKTKKEKYGDENYNNRDKAKETCLSLYGAINPAMNSGVKNKMRKSILSKTLGNWEQYLINNNYELLDEFNGTHVSRYLESDEVNHWTKYRFKHKDCGYIFKASFNGFNIRCPKCYPYNKSIKEIKYNALIEDNGLSTELGVRDKISPYEIDIFIPDLDVGFEYNGTYWHSIVHERIYRTYHKDKTELCLQKRIKLYHIWEHNNEDIIKSMIKSVLNKTDTKIYARKCKIQEVKTEERREFFNSNHLHGDVKSKLSCGLYYENELVSCISFRKHKEGIEIARFASKLNTSVVGGFSKLLKYSILKLKELGYTKIITYCDRDWTPDYKDSVYYKNGFNFIGDSGCSLFYIVSDKLYSREVFQKHKLKELFPESYSDSKTANEILVENNIYPCYNSGNWKLELII